MSELTKRLEGSVCYASTNKEWPNVLLQEAADRIDKLEECLREILEEPQFLGCESAAKLKARALLEEK